MPFDFDKECQSDLDADIRLFELVSASKAEFFDEIVNNRDPDCSVSTRELRQEIVYQLAEFLYLLRMFRINSPKKLRKFAIVHNEKVEQLLNNTDEQEKLGVYPQRLRDTLFDTEEKLDRLEANCGPRTIRLSQSDLARLMVEYMSPETCRQTVKTLSEAGFLKLSKSPFGAVLVTSTGQIEQIFANHIRSFRKSL